MPLCYLHCTQQLLTLCMRLRFAFVSMYLPLITVGVLLNLRVIAVFLFCWRSEKTFDLLAVLIIDSHKVYFIH